MCKNPSTVWRVALTPLTQLTHLTLLIMFACVCCLGAPVRAAQAASSPSSSPSSSLSGAITVSAAASLTDAFTELKALFEAANPNTSLRLNFAASGPLLRQIEMGAPVDVFASADEVTMDKASQAALIDDAHRITFTTNSLVLIAPAALSATGAQATLPNILASAYLTAATTERIAIGNPDSVPAGRYAKASLTSMSLWDELAPKYVMGANVRQVLDYVNRGEVEAGIVYLTDANLALKAHTAILVATLTGHPAVSYPIAPCKNPAASPEQAALAQAFIDFVMSPQGQAVLASYGFGG
ncbi:MAG: molybdate ABC transporter substrate-binding protein [Pseudomonadota bacterium]